MFPENLVQACFQQVILTFAHIAPLFPLSVTFFFPAITQQMELAHQNGRRCTWEWRHFRCLCTVSWSFSHSELGACCSLFCSLFFFFMSLSTPQKRGSNGASQKKMSSDEYFLFFLISLYHPKYHREPLFPPLASLPCQ